MKLFCSLASPYPYARPTQLVYGTINAAAAMVVEAKKRPAEYWWQGWLDRQQTSIARTLNALGTEAASLQEGKVGCTKTSLACGRTYLDGRFPNVGRRDPRLGVTRWYGVLNRRTFMVETQSPA